MVLHFFFVMVYASLLEAYKGLKPYSFGKEEAPLKIGVFSEALGNEKTARLKVFQSLSYSKGF